MELFYCFIFLLSLGFAGVSLCVSRYNYIVLSLVIFLLLSVLVKLLVFVKINLIITVALIWSSYLQQC